MVYSDGLQVKTCAAPQKASEESMKAHPPPQGTPRRSQMDTTHHPRGWPQHQPRTDSRRAVKHSGSHHNLPLHPPSGSSHPLAAVLRPRPTLHPLEVSLRPPAASLHPLEASLRPVTPGYCLEPQCWQPAAAAVGDNRFHVASHLRRKFAGKDRPVSNSDGPQRMTRAKQAC